MFYSYFITNYPNIIPLKNNRKVVKVICDNKSKNYLTAFKHSFQNYLGNKIDIYV